jgi:hypothetical protein
MMLVRSLADKRIPQINPWRNGPLSLFHEMQLGVIAITRTDANSSKKVVRPERFELPTLCFEVARVLSSKLAGASAKAGKISKL